MERGRPEIAPGKLEEAKEWSWLRIFEACVSEESTDLHVPKAVRSLHYFATNLGLNEAQKEEIRKGAAVIVTELVLPGRGDINVGVERAKGGKGSGFQRGWRYDARGFVEREAGSRM